MRINPQDNVEVTSHFAEVIGAAQNCGASSVSIQNYYTFCNFKTENNAKLFSSWCQKMGKSTNGINTERPFVPFEVAVRHPS